MFYMRDFSYRIGQIATSHTQSWMNLSTPPIIGQAQWRRSLHIQRSAQVAMGKHRVAEAFAHAQTYGKWKQDVGEFLFHPYPPTISTSHTLSCRKEKSL